MARNRSEKLPRCPEAHAYANAFEKYLAGSETQERAISLWYAIPNELRWRMKQALGIHVHSDAHDAMTVDERQRLYLAYIRKTYGA